MSRAPRWLLAAAAAVATAALASGLGRTDLWPPDEPRVAEIAREMAADQSWLIPKLNGQPFVEEPPLFYWMQAGVYRLVGGPSAAAARVPAAAGAIVGVLATAALAVRTGASPVLAVVVLATAPEYWWMARSATPDTAAAAATALALLAFFVAWQSGRRGLLPAVVLALGVAFWCKSLLPVGLGVLAMAAFVAGAGWGRLRVRDVLLAAGAVAALCAAWSSVLAVAVGARAATFFLVTNHLGRLVGLEVEAHRRSMVYYLPNLALDLFPWSLLLPAALAAAWRERSAPGRRFALVWAGSMLIALSLSASKRAHYLLPAYPAFALLVAQWWPQAWRGRLDRVAWRLMTIVLLIVGPVLMVAMLSLRMEDILAAGDAGRDASAAMAIVLRNLAPPGSAWLVGVVLLLVGVLLLRAERSRSVTGCATALAAYVTVIHLALTLVVLPRLNPLCTARPEAERLGRLADRGVRLVAFGFEDSGALSPVLFYARRRVPNVEDVTDLVTHLRTGPSCALMRVQDYAALASTLPGSPVYRDTGAGLRLMIVESEPGLCATVASGRGDGDERS